MNVEFELNLQSISAQVSRKFVSRMFVFAHRHLDVLVSAFAIVLSWNSWFFAFARGYHLVYNDAMSHMDIARRVVDNLTPGVAQLGSVWLPLLHILMLPTVWIDIFWQLGISAGIVSMVSFVATVVAVYKIIKVLTKSIFGAVMAALVVALNTNFLYLQTTALTEPLFMATSSLALYYLVVWAKFKDPGKLIGAGFFVMLSTLTRYDGWAMLAVAVIAIFLSIWWKYRSFAKAQGMTVLFATIAGFGVVLWLLWNQVIFGDPLFFATGDFSAKAQQDLLATSGDLPTKGNLWLSMKTYYFAMISNIGIVTLGLGTLGWAVFMRKVKSVLLFAVGVVFVSVIVFNVVALYLGQSVIHLPQIVGNTWFNVRYGLLALPWAAVFIGYLGSQSKLVARSTIVFLLFLQTGLFFSSGYVVTLDDGLWGSSQKNVRTIGQWIGDNIGKDGGLVLVSVASHDAILFSSGLPMKQFIHEGTGEIWREAIVDPTRRAKYVIMRTHDKLDLVARNIDLVDGFFEKYELVYDDEFADIYEVKDTEDVQALSQNSG